jgi:hypothetical protein
VRSFQADPAAREWGRPREPATERTRRSNADAAAQTNPARPRAARSKQPQPLASKRASRPSRGTQRATQRTRRCSVQAEPAIGEAKRTQPLASKRIQPFIQTHPAARPTEPGDVALRRNRRSENPNEPSLTQTNPPDPNEPGGGGLRTLPRPRDVACVRCGVAQAGAGAARASATPCHVVRPSSRRGPMRESAAVNWARLSRLWTARKSSTCLMIARAPAARGA